MDFSLNLHTSTSCILALESITADCVSNTAIAHNHRFASFVLICKYKKFRFGLRDSIVDT